MTGRRRRRKVTPLMLFRQKNAKLKKQHLRRFTPQEYEHEYSDL